MLRHIWHDLEWGLVFIAIVLILFLLISLLTIQPAIAERSLQVIASITETDIAPGQIHCRSEQILTDETGHKWQVMLFTQVDSSSYPSLNLRLSGLSSSVNIQSRKPLVISTESDRSKDLSMLRYEAQNIFLDKPPLPSIGQYDLKNIFPQLPTVELLLELPLESGKSARLHVPTAVVKEWQAVAAKNPPASKKLPTGFQLVC